MIRTAVARLAAAAILIVSVLGFAARSVQASAEVTAAQAAPFLGDWSIALQGQQGPANFDLVVETDKDKVVARISGTQTPQQAIPSITLAEKTLVLRYAFDYQGMSIETVLSLTPAADGKVSAEMDFAGGAYVATGTATKKDKGK